MTYCLFHIFESNFLIQINYLIIIYHKDNHGKDK